MTSRELPDFDTLMNLAKEDPEALEQLRNQLSQQLIESAPEGVKQRLRGLQFQIDARRNLASNPTAACVSISRMMHESFSRLQSALNAPLSTPFPAETGCAKILHFTAPVAFA